MIEIAINFFKWIREKIGIEGDGKEIERIVAQEVTNGVGASDALNVIYQEVAVWACINLISNAISKCEFKTFVNGEEKKGGEYYQWNIAPNKNLNASEFINKWISKLFLKNEALIVEVDDGSLQVADSYETTKYMKYDYAFKQVTVDGFTFNKTFLQSEVLFFQLGEKNMNRLSERLLESYKPILDYGMKAYKKSRGTKATLEVGTNFTNQQYDEKGNRLPTEADMIAENVTSFLEKESAVLPLPNGYKYDENGSKTYSNEATRDIRAMIDDISAFTARCFGIHPDLITGNVQDVSKALDHFLTFKIDPLCRMLEREIIQKRYGENEFRKGNYLKIDTRAIKHIDIMDIATAVDKLISSGVESVNELREITGQQRINEPWADVHFITRNYTTFEETMAYKGEEATKNEEE
ncbi:MAG: phage portal protein [Eubacterium sp.]